MSVVGHNSLSCCDAGCGRSSPDSRRPVGFCVSINVRHSNSRRELSASAHPEKHAPTDLPCSHHVGIGPSRTSPGRLPHARSWVISGPRSRLEKHEALDGNAVNVAPPSSSSAASGRSVAATPPLRSATARPLLRNAYIVTTSPEPRRPSRHQARRRHAASTVPRSSAARAGTWDA